MNSDRFPHDWTELKERLRKKWNQLTDDDLREIDGHRDRLFRKLLEKYGLNREQAEAQFKELQSGGSAGRVQ